MADTTASGASAAGAAISVGTINGDYTLTLNSGTGGTAAGAVTLGGIIGGTTPPKSVTVTGNTIAQPSAITTTNNAGAGISYTVTGASPLISVGANQTTSLGSITWSGAASLGTNILADTTNGGASAAGAAISLGAVNGDYTLTLNGGTGGTAAGAVTLGGIIGGTTPPKSVTVTGNTIAQPSAITTTNSAGAGISYTVTGASPLISVGANQTTSLGSITWSGAASLGTNILADTTNGGASAAGAAISVGAVNGDYTLTLNGGTGGTAAGAVTLGGIIGGTTPPKSVTVTGNTINQSAALTTTNNAGAGISYTVTGASPLITVSANQTTNLGSITWSGAASLGGNSVADTTASGASAAGAAISVGTINGDYTLTLNSGTGVTAAGAVTLGGIIGGTTPPKSVTVTGNTIAQPSAITTTNNAGAGISYTVTGASPLISVGANQTTSLGSITWSGAASLGTNILADTTNGGASAAGAAISLGAVNGDYTLTLNGGTGGTAAGAVTLGGIIGGTTPPKSVTVTGNTINQSAALTTTNNAGAGISYTVTGASPLITVSANQTTNLGSITWSGAASLGGNAVADTTASGVSAAGAAISVGTINGDYTLTLNSGTGGTAAGAVTLGGIIGGTTPPKSVTVTGNTIAQPSAITTTNNAGAGISYTVTGASPLISVGANQTTSLGSITWSGAASLGTNILADTTNGGASAAGAAISLGAVNGDYTLTLNGGTGGTAAGAVTLGGIIGGTTPPKSVTVTGNTIAQPSAITTTNSAGAGISYTVTGASPLISVGANQTTNLGSITWSGAASLGTNILADTTNGGASAAGAAISVGAVNGDYTLTLNGGTGGTAAGAVALGGIIGGTTPPKSVTVTGNTINQSAALTTTNNAGAGISYTVTGASPLITVSANQTTNLGSITWSGAASLGGNSVADTTASGASAAGAAISVGTINGDYTLTLNSGTGVTAAGAVTLGGIIGGTTPPKSVTVTGNTIAQPSAITTTNNAGAGISYTVTGASPLISVGANQTTSLGSITWSGAASLGTNILADTTNGGASAAGAAISLGAVNGDYTLTLNGGTGGTAAGAVTLGGIIGGTTPPKSVTVTGNTINQSAALTTTNNAGAGISYTVTGASPLITVSANQTTNLGSITWSGAASLGGNAVADTTASGVSAAGAAISVGTINGDYTLTLNSGTGGTAAGAVTLGGIIGGTTPPKSVTVTGNTIAQPSAITTTNNAGAGISYTVTGASPLISVGANQTTSLGSITWSGAASLGTNILADTTNGGASAAGAAISLGAVNGDYTLTLNGGTGGTAAGAVTLGGIIGGTTPPKSVTVTGNTIAQPSAITTTNSAGAGISYTVTGASPLISVGANQTTNLGSITWSGAASLGTNILADTTNSGASAAGAAISVGAVNGDYTLTLNGGTGGTAAGAVTLGGIIGGTTPPKSVTVTGNTINQSAALTTTNNAGAGISYTVTGASPLITVSANQTTNLGSITWSGAASLGGNSVADTTASGASAAGAAISVGTINGDYTLTLNSGTGVTAAGAVTLGGIIGGTTPPKSVTVTGNTIAQPSAITTTNSAGAGISYTVTGASPLISVGANQTTSLGSITWSGAASLGTNILADTTNGGASAAGAAISLGAVNGDYTLTLNGGTGGTAAGAVTLGGIIGGTTPPKSVTVTGNTINQSAALTTTNNAGAGISYTVTGASPLISVGANQTTSLGSITWSGAASLGTNILADTTNGGASAAGAAIGIGAVNGDYTLTLNGGTGGTAAGAVTLGGIIGGTTPPKSVTVTGNTINQSAALTTTNNAGTGISYTVTGASPLITVSADQTTNLGSINWSGAVALGANIVVDTTNGTLAGLGADITATDTINGTHNLVIYAGSGGEIIFGDNVGGISPLAQLDAYYSVPLNLSVNITANGAAPASVSLSGPIVLSSSPLITAGNGGVDFGSTIEATTPGVEGLTLNATGSILFEGSVGDVTPLSTLTCNGPSVIGSTSAVNMTAQSDILFNGAVTLGNHSTMKVTAALGTLTFASTVNGAYNLTLGSAISHIPLVIFEDTVGNSIPLGIVNVYSDPTQIFANMTQASLYFNSGDVQLESTPIILHATGGNVEFSSTSPIYSDVGGPYDLSIVASGDVVFGASAGGAGNGLQSLNVTASSIQINANQTVVSGPMIYSGPVVLTAAVTLSDNGASAMSFVSDITGNYDLNL